MARVAPACVQFLGDAPGDGTLVGQPEDHGRLTRQIDHACSSSVVRAKCEQTAQPSRFLEYQPHRWQISRPGRPARPCPPAARESASRAVRISPPNPSRSSAIWSSDRSPCVRILRRAPTISAPRPPPQLPPSRSPASRQARRAQSADAAADNACSPAPACPACMPSAAQLSAVVSSSR